MCLCVCERGRERASASVCIDISGKLHCSLTTHWIFRDSLMLIGDCNTCSSYINAGDCEPQHIDRQKNRQWIVVSCNHGV